MSKPVLTFDLDGVVVGGNYTPAWEGRPETYRTLPVMDPHAPMILDELARVYNLYYVTSRKFDGALEVSRDWLARKGFPIGCGVVCYGSSSLEKPIMLAMLKSRLHIDDHPGVVGAYNDKSVLFVGRDPAGWWPGTEQAMKTFPTIRGWDEVEGVVAQRLGQMKLPF